MLNCDLKILTMLLAHRLNSIIGEIIHLDQTGFITGRYSGNNIPRLLNVMAHSQKVKEEIMVLGLHAEKAFDSVS